MFMLTSFIFVIENLKVEELFMYMMTMSSVLTVI